MIADSDDLDALAHETQRAREPNPHQRADLCCDHVLDFAFGHRNHPATEAFPVGVARMRPERRRAARRRERHEHRLGVAGVAAGGDVGARSEIHHRRVVADRPRAETLAEVRVQVDPAHLRHQVLLSAGVARTRRVDAARLIGVSNR